MNFYSIMSKLLPPAHKSVDLIFTSAEFDEILRNIQAEAKESVSYKKGAA